MNRNKQYDDAQAVNECQPQFTYLQDSMVVDERDDTTSTFDDIILDEMLERVLQTNFFERDRCLPARLFILPTAINGDTVQDEYERV